MVGWFVNFVFSYSFKAHTHAARLPAKKHLYTASQYNKNYVELENFKSIKFKKFQKLLLIMER